MGIVQSSLLSLKPPDGGMVPPRIAKDSEGAAAPEGRRAFMAKMKIVAPVVAA
jgi:hypothetical protein